MPYETPAPLFWSLLNDPSGSQRYMGRTSSPYFNYVVNTQGGQPTSNQLDYMYQAMFGRQPSLLERIGLLLSNTLPGTNAIDVGDSLVMRLTGGR